MKNTLSTKIQNPLIARMNSCKEFHAAAVQCADSEQGSFPLQVSGLKGSLPAFFIRQIAERHLQNRIHQAQYENKNQQFQKDTVIVVPTQKEADECESDLATVFEDEAGIFKFPWWGTIPYRPSAKGSAVFGERAGLLAKLAVRNPVSEKPRIFIIPQRAFLTPVPPAAYTRSQITVLRKGQEFDPEKLAEKLASQGYLRVPKIGMKGEFVLRGEVLEIFMSGESSAHRIVFDFDTISQIKLFDTETQASRESIDRLVIYPQKEVVWNEALIEKLTSEWEKEDQGGIKNSFAEYDMAKRQITNNRSFEKQQKSVENSENNDRSEAEPTDTADENPTNKQSSVAQAVHLSLTENAKKEQERIISELAEFGTTEGEELFYPVLFDKLYSVLDYITEDTDVFCLDWDRLVNAKKMLENECNAAYRLARQNLPVFQPDTVQLDFFTLASSCRRLTAFRTLDTLSNSEEGSQDSPVSFCTSVELQSEPGQSYFGNIAYLKEQLEAFSRENYSIFVYADNANQAARIQEVIKEFCAPGGVTIFPNALTSGFMISSEKLLVIQENEIFGRKKNIPKSARKAKSRAIDTFVELTPGDYVVHVNYGIGLFKGIERVRTMGMERDYIKLEYADEEIAFIPIEQVNMVQRYIGSENEHPRLDRIGSKSWSERKSKVQKKVEEIAEKLIDLYSKRKASRGFPFPKDTEWNAAFEAAFPYEDTADQFSATREIKEDMEKPVPMDRLVCGDVGYGKTEIAMRAAFKAVMGGKQVAFLAPTTILAEQHFENCTERFRNFPVTIAQLSRFIPPSEQKKTLAKLQNGEIDILIGTHRILQKDVVFKDLGLMIIDEEQRFGVKDKEKLKTLKTNIDCLAMSATPIPRTLHMSLLKIRDMSLLTTPPQNRQPIETVIEEYNDEKIAAAVRNEVQRGGQVFFLHNRVETLDETRLRLERLLPEMLVETAHGKMTSEELDDIFRRFKMGGFHILVATTIIENGIDIPNVNTIIIDRADMYGVSQLYQLRGRVGRSDRKAYAYLFYPRDKALSEVAMKRLQVISDFTELGSGFKIAMKDMEIRGAGNLLGKDQSGEIYAVGFEMYLNLLNSAIERLSNSDWHSPDEVLLELEYTGFIPDSYIKDAQTKMELYKKIASVQTQDSLDAVWEELFDRFGPVPDEVVSLLSLAKIRIICNRLSVSSLKEKQGIVQIEFSRVSKINIDKVIGLIQSSSGRVKLDPARPNQIILQTGTIDLKSKSEFIKEKLEQLI
ncbi:transcription-repair coupling factor [Treponema sp.]|uniref:transcription-repair coupling factor n=1 Tax=Treponema sp. TaxID=166 RepID=UPI003F094CD9